MSLKWYEGKCCSGFPECIHKPKGDYQKIQELLKENTALKEEVDGLKATLLADHNDLRGQIKVLREALEKISTHGITFHISDAWMIQTAMEALEATKGDA